MQTGAGAAGIAVAKVSEAEQMVENEKGDITVAYPALGRQRGERIATLAEQHFIRVAVDSEYLMNELSDAALRHHTVIGIHIMFDAGLHRCGTADTQQVKNSLHFILIEISLI